MKKIKKVMAAALGAAMMMAAFSGCSSDSDSSTVTTKAPGESSQAEVTNEEITLTVWESTEGPDKWIEQAGAKFTEQHPNIKIKYVNVELGDTTSAIALDGPAGTGPDLFAAPHDKLGELVSGGHVLPTVDGDRISEMVLGACSSALTYEGTMYGYPQSAETYALYYNKDLISEADVPKTWEDLILWTNDFNAANTDKYGFVMDVTSCYYTILFMTADGNRLFGPEGLDTSSSYLNTPAAVEGMTLFQSLKSAMRNVASADLGTDTADGAFESGSAAMHISGPWNISRFTDAGLNFGVT
ncbi:MAG: extracellular solute-binding protein, partial [Oscillospiraceae bacterium]